MAQEYHPTLKSWFTSTPDERIANRRLLLSLRGRVGRQTCWQFAFVPAAAFMALAVQVDLSARMGAFGFTVCGLLLCWIVLAVSVKRCHDRGRSGWFLLVKLIPVIGVLWVLVELGLLPAAAASKRYELGSSAELAEAAEH